MARRKKDVEEIKEEIVQETVTAEQEAETPMTQEQSEQEAPKLEKKEEPVKDGEVLGGKKKSRQSRKLGQAAIQ